MTFLSDAARQDKFGAFKVDPDSIKQVLPTDGLENTTQGKYFKGGWLLFPKVFTGIITFENDGLSICIPNQFSLSNYFFEKEAKFGPSL